MKILQVITRSDTVGGAQKHVYDVSVQLKQDKHDVEIVSSGTGEFKRLVEGAGLKYINLKYMKRELSLFSDAVVLIKLRKLIKSRMPDVVALHSVKAGLLGRIACLGLNCRVVFTAHGWSHIKSSNGFKKRVYEFLELVLSKVSSQVICVSKSDYNYSLNSIGIESSKLSLIQNGVHEPLIGKDIIRVKRPSSVLKLLSVVRFQAPKDFVTLLAALKVIKDLPWSLSVIGDGEDFEKVNREIISNGLEAKILLHGFQKDTSKYYTNSDVVLLISESEGLPLSIIEAMSFSKVLIASNVGGLPELVRHGVNGYLIEPYDYTGLAKVITELIQMKSDEFYKMSDMSYDLYVDNFSFDTMMKKIYIVYKRD